jgi:hypothetical protein
MRLLNINYWAGKRKNEILVLLIKIDESGQLIGLRSDKMGASDISKIRKNSDTLDVLGSDDLEEWLRSNISTFSSALTKMKRGRYEIIGEYAVSG